MSNQNDLTMSQFKKQAKLYGWKRIKATRLHNRIDQLDKEAFELCNDINAYLSNRKNCWDLTRKLIKLKGE